jgi:integrase
MHVERLLIQPALLVVAVTAPRVSRRRAYGTGSLLTQPTARGGETWYGQFRIQGRLVKRALGPKRGTRNPNGLTRTQAERKLRQLIEATRPLPPERVTVEEAGRRLVAHLAELGRKRSTLAAYESCLRVHLVPHFRSRPLHRITREQVEAFIALKRKDGLAPKSVLNYLGILHSIFAFAERRGLVAGNVCKLVDKPQAAGGEDRIRYLTPAELDELLGAAERADGPIAATDRVVYLTAALTGLRQGELLALRWRDVDWDARRIRVRESLVRGEFTTPKSRRGLRSVPLATRVADELAEHRGGSGFAGPDDLVFCHPRLGGPLERSRLFKRFKGVAVAAGFPALRFHDLRHTFGTRMAAAGVPLRTLQEWMGHRDFKTTLVYADYQPRDDEVALVDRALEGS